MRRVPSLQGGKVLTLLVRVGKTRTTGRVLGVNIIVERPPPPETRRTEPPEHDNEDIRPLSLEGT